MELCGEAPHESNLGKVDSPSVRTKVHSKHSLKRAREKKVSSLGFFCKGRLHSSAAGSDQPTAARLGGPLQPKRVTPLPHCRIDHTGESEMPWCCTSNRIRDQLLRLVEAGSCVRHGKRNVATSQLRELRGEPLAAACQCKPQWARFSGRYTKEHPEGKAREY